MKIDFNRRRAVSKEYPPRQCSGTATTTGEQCKRYAEVGATVCMKHGAAAPQVRAATERRLVLAEALANKDYRPSWEVIQQSLHVIDVLMQQAIDVIVESGTATAKQIDTLTACADRAARLGKAAFDAGLDARRLQLQMSQAGQMQRFVIRLLEGLNLTEEQKALVPSLIEREAQREIEGVAVEARPR